ncbi:GlsB/YeaQ/YmgE family stress response membrane protein [Cutibacterium sp.]|uniref:GlsB/YeaQ/YmgE family stress response membrane protein n=1 Tax=Cutibacterium sp. TaxID=1912221 RepID=UPI0026DBD267|nr:GlsB/YeaQ/YmgE family stress response membrane protein [Cutibacterium sp.]MDO4413185.1 GlsB/YeaQ/YmgE family stress response membrane protein [Cutibacterium sp.]
MGFFAWIILGLIAGAIAKAIMPGKQGGGIFVTLILGVVGAVLGGWLGSFIFNKPLGDFWNLWTWLVSIVGALIVLWIWGAITKKKNKQ